MTAPRLDAPSLAFALSGGGHRATLFTLGVLIYVVDAGRNRKTTSIASVSGGSLTNGFVGQTLDFRSATPESFEREVARPLAGQIARKGTVFGPWLTKLYIVLVVLGFFSAFLPLWLWRVPWWWRGFAVLLLLLVWGSLFGLRGRVCGWAFRKTLFSPNGTATRLSDIHKGVLHVICATELRTGETVYFSRDFVYGYGFGHGQPDTLPLYRAVQASAAFPGGLPPTRIASTSFRFSDRPTRRLVLTDGGVYDNMGDEWAMNFNRRAKDWDWLDKHCPAPSQLVVVNASAREPWVPYRTGWIPLWREIAAFLRVIAIMYDNTTSGRRHQIVESFSPLRPDDVGHLPAALVQIAQSPFRVAERFAGIDGHPVGERARAVISALGTASRPEWEEIASQNSAVATTLRKLGVDVSARLMYQGYVTAMCNLHVLFGTDGPLGGWPLLKVPALARFIDLAARS